jgi:putative ABC transport system permease protein
MTRFLWSQLRFRRSRTAALAAAVFVAAVGFTLLTGTAQTSQLHVHGTLSSSFRPAYDILVRPSGSESALERSEGLVRPNFLSGLYGGISFAQWHRIVGMNGVAVAAPIANIGFIFPFEDFPVSLGNVVTSAHHQLYRIAASWVADDGASRFPQAVSYVYYSPRDRFVQPSSTGSFLEKGPDASRPVASCGGFLASMPQQPTSPFPPIGSEATLLCFPTTHGVNGTTVNGFLATPQRFVGTTVAGYFPIYISAIDPVQEAKLVHLDRAVVSGRYLREDEGLIARLGGASELVPVLASNRSYISDRLQLTVRRLAVPGGVNLPAKLASVQARTFAASRNGAVVERRTLPLEAFYHRLLATPPQTSWPPGTLFSQAYWTTGPTRYQALAPNELAPTAVRNPLTIWRSQFSNWYLPPRENLDTQFRPLHERVQSNVFVHGAPQFHPLKVIGEFDPTKLPGFSPLTKVPLETYYPPTLTPTDAATRAALHGRPLTASQNLGGYVQPPPLLLTNMRGLETFLNPRDWSSSISSEESLTKGTNASAIPKAQRLAPISAIRVKVSGVSGPDRLSLERIKVVAQRIHTLTGLAIDITAGSSPHPVEIALPKGRFGRPGLLLREGWSKKGVTVSFLQALDRKDLALFALVLVICGFFLGNGAFASVRARRAELGTLLTLGWTHRAIFRAVLTELAVVGLLAGGLGTALAAAVVRIFALRVSLLHVVIVLPLAVLLALAAGFVPAWAASRGLPLDALRPPVTSRHARSVRRFGGFAMANLLRLPMRTLLGASGLAIGVAALTVLVGIERAFRGTLVGSVLGNAISLQVRGADFVAVALTLALAAFSVADVVYLNLSERRVELVTLQTLGWTNGHLRSVVLLESVGLGLLGSGVGGITGIVVCEALLDIPIAPTLVAVISASGAGVLATILASLIPVMRVSRVIAPTVFAAAE